MADEKSGCARPTGAQVGEEAPTQEPEAVSVKEEMTMTAQVGGKAPDFTAPAYYQGEFTTVHLLDYLGKWTMLCFYPGDFTFV